MKRKVYVVALALSLLLCGCAGDSSNEQHVMEVESTEAQMLEIATEQPVAMSETVNPIHISVWPTYWDVKTVMDEIEAMQNEIDEICYFAAYFDEMQQLFIPEKTIQTKDEVEFLYTEKGWKQYLTVVNDLLLAEGGSSLKDTKLLYQLLENADDRTRHIQELLLMVREHGFDGIEIDYEAIKKDMQLWDYYLIFVEELYKAATEQGILVRVLLEPGVPIDKVAFPEGPEYVMMCYNLYGYGTEPGPKANKEFIGQIVEKMNSIPGEKGLAFSVGGFDFSSDGTVAQLTEAQCIALREIYSCEVYRDEASYDLVFSYMDEKGMKHQVWYADKETLYWWMDIAKEHGYHRFSVWRLGSFSSALN